MNDVPDLPIPTPDPVVQPDAGAMTQPDMSSILPPDMSTMAPPLDISVMGPQPVMGVTTPDITLQSDLSPMVPPPDMSSMVQPLDMGVTTPEITLQGDLNAMSPPPDISPMAQPLDVNSGLQSSDGAPTSFPGDVPQPVSIPEVTLQGDLRALAPPPVAADAAGLQSSPDGATSFPGDTAGPPSPASGPTPEQCENWNAGLPDEWANQCPAPGPPVEMEDDKPLRVDVNNPWFADTPLGSGSRSFDETTMGGSGNVTIPEVTIPGDLDALTPPSEPVTIPEVTIVGKPDVPVPEITTPLTIPPDQTSSIGPLTKEQFEEGKQKMADTQEKTQEKMRDFLRELGSTPPEEFQKPGLPLEPKLGE